MEYRKDNIAVQLTKYQKDGWGSKFIDTLAADIALPFDINCCRAEKCVGAFAFFGLQTASQTWNCLIKLDFPKITGFSVRNLKYMRKFAQEYPDFEFVQTVSAQITWSHNTLLLDKIVDGKERKWYMKKSVENGWFLNVLRHQLETAAARALN